MVVLFLAVVALGSYNDVVVLLLASVDSFVAGLFLFRASIHWHSDDKDISSPQGGMTCSTPTEVDDSIIVTSSFLGKLKLLSPGLMRIRVVVQIETLVGKGMFQVQIQKLLKKVVKG